MQTKMSRPRIGYWIGHRLYLSVTGRANGLTYLQARGPGFQMPAETGFSDIDRAYEPTPEELFEEVDHAYETDERKNITGMGENDEGVVFAGAGEPLLRLEAITEAASLIKAKRHGIPLAINTNGLSTNCNEDAAKLVAAGIKDVTVLLPCADPVTYEKMSMVQDKDKSRFHFGTVCEFITSLVESGAIVRCMTTPAPGVDVNAVKELARALGAVEVKVKDYHA